MQQIELAIHLENLARRGITTTYEALANHFGLPRLDGNWKNHPLAFAFEELDEEDSMQGRPFRTSVVVSKATSIPGPGYFASLEKHKRIQTKRKEDEMAIFIEQFQAVTAYKW